jgi:hypothetical protein
VFIYPIFIAIAMSIGNFLATRLQGWVVQREDEGRPVKFLSFGKKPAREELSEAV